MDKRFQFLWQSEQLGEWMKTGEPREFLSNFAKFVLSYKISYKGCKFFAYKANSEIGPECRCREDLLDAIPVA